MTVFDPLHPDEASLRAIDVHELLPQQEPFVMVGRLTAFSRRSFASETAVGERNIFVEGDTLSVPGLIENIAQTCAARIGYVNKYFLNQGIRIGYIGAIRNLSVHRLPHVGETITTRVDVIEELFGMTLAHAAVTVGAETIAETEMKIAVKNEE